MKYLLFQLYGAMQSWGSACPGNTRMTEDHPTKSGVLGLVGACLGIDYRDTDTLRDLHATIGFACRMDIPGILLEDYHTVAREYRPHKVMFQTIVTERYYLQGALFTACLWDDDEGGLEDIKQALVEPHFTPYLGRSGCLPGLPFQPQIIEATALKEAFGKYRADELGFLAMPMSNPEVFWEGLDQSIPVTNTAYRYDSPKSMGITKTFGRRLEFEGRL